MRETGLESSAEGREVLDYLVQCALNERQSVHFKHAGQHFEYRGSIGLAPNWADEPLDESQQRWVSACMLSRINYYGRKVLISLRTPNLEATVTTTRDLNEIATYTLHEGGFFGNLFSDNPIAYACRGSRDNIVSGSVALKARRCTEPSGHSDANSQPLTLCNFIDSGKCPDIDRIDIGGSEWTEIVHIFLNPNAGYAD